MAIWSFYFTGGLLLLSLSWPTSTALPVSTLSPRRCQHCSLLFKNLLPKISELLKNDVLCFGITSDKTVLSSNAETVLACSPSPSPKSGCMMQRNSTFSESECLRNIMKDLAHYAAAIQSYLNSPLRSPEEEVALLSPTLGIIQSLRKSCSPRPDEEDSSEEAAAQMWGDETFSNRQGMCKIMRGFYARTITINRAMSYISSGEHRK